MTITLERPIVRRPSAPLSRPKVPERRWSRAAKVALWVTLVLVALALTFLTVASILWAKVLMHMPLIA